MRLRTGEPVTVGAEGERKAARAQGLGRHEVHRRGRGRHGRVRCGRRARPGARRPVAGLPAVPARHPRDVARADGHLPPGRPARPTTTWSATRSEAAVDTAGGPADDAYLARPAARTRHLDRRVSSRPHRRPGTVGALDDGGGPARARPTASLPMASGASSRSTSPRSSRPARGRSSATASCGPSPSAPLVLLVRRDLGWIRPFVARPRLVGGITIAALLIATNWTSTCSPCSPDAPTRRRWATSSTRSSPWRSASSCSASGCGRCSGPPSPSARSPRSTSRSPAGCCRGSR